MRTITFLFATLLSFSVWAGIAPGDEAPAFNLKNIDGKMVSFESFEEAKGFIVIFTCNHCPFSVAYEDRINALDAKYKELGYPVIAINPNDAKAYPVDSYEQMQKRAADKSFTFPYLHDESQEIAKAYGAVKTPHVFLIEKSEKGNICQYVGAIDDNSWEEENVKNNYLMSAIEALENGKKPMPAVTKAVGCSVKWKK